MAPDEISSQEIYGHFFLQSAGESVFTKLIDCGGLTLLHPHEIVERFRD
jgi:hypothetical protein